jgi:hypothetical protein
LQQLAYLSRRWRWPPVLAVERAQLRVVEQEAVQRRAVAELLPAVREQAVALLAVEV